MMNKVKNIDSRIKKWTEDELQHSLGNGEGSGSSPYEGIKALNRKNPIDAKRRLF